MLLTAAMPFNFSSPEYLSHHRTRKTQVSPVSRASPAHIISPLDYCNSILYGLPSSELIKLQRVQNAAARLVTSTPRYCHITPILYELHWLPVKFRIDFKLLLITFKALYGMAPKYIADLLNIRKKLKATILYDLMIV